MAKPPAGPRADQHNLRMARETRADIRLARVLHSSQEKKESTWKTLLPMVGIPVLTCVLGAIAGVLGTGFQTYETMRTWASQHNDEVAEKVLAKKMDILDDLQKTLTKVYDIDAQVGMIGQTHLAAIALKQYGIPIKAEDINDVVKLPYGDAILENREAYSRLQVLSQDIDIYFNNRTSTEMKKLVFAISNEPNVPFDPGYFINAFGELKALGKLDLYDIQLVLERPELVEHPSPLIENLQGEVIKEIKESIRHDIAATSKAVAQ